MEEKPKRTVLAVLLPTVSRVNFIKSQLSVERNGETVTQDETLNVLINHWLKTHQNQQHQNLSTN